MQIIAAIERDLYTVISDSIASERVIITDERVEHIRQRHPGDWEHYSAFISDTITDPDFILRDDHPDTAICVRQVVTGGEIRFLRTTLRLQARKEIKERENSVLTFQKINRKEYGRLSRSKKVVYKRSEP